MTKIEEKIKERLPLIEQAITNLVSKRNALEEELEQTKNLIQQEVGKYQLSQELLGEDAPPLNLESVEEEASKKEEKPKPKSPRRNKS